MTTDRPSVDGLLLVDKSAGLTSHDVVDIVRRAYGERSIGHLGTLDPFATGLLVLLLGRSTRLATFIDNEPKTYEATIAFGAATDTDDVTGTIVREAELPLQADVAAAIPALTGPLSQIPPAYSAKKVAGARAYDMAREGETFTLPPSDVVVHDWRIIAWHTDPNDPTRVQSLDVAITCGTGTYIRALARDLGQSTNSAGHLTVLRRVSSGPFHVRDAATLDLIKSDARPSIRALRVVAD